MDNERHHQPTAPPHPRFKKTSHKRLLQALADAVDSDQGGEVVVVFERSIGRIFVTEGRIAWVIASSLNTTLRDRLVEHAGLAVEELREVFQECRITGKNFGETLIEWGLADRETVRSQLLDHGAEGIVAIMAWPEPEPLYIPHAREYHGTLLFEYDELIERALELCGERLPPETRALLEEVIGRDSEAEARARHIEAPEASPWDAVCRRVSTVTLGFFDALEEVEGFLAAAFIDEDGQPIIVRQSSAEEMTGIGGRSLELLYYAQTLAQKLGLTASHTVQLDSKDGVILIHPVILAEEEGDVGRHVVALFSSPVNSGLARVRLRVVARGLARRKD